MRIIIAGSRPPREIRTNRPLLEKWYWYLSMYGFVETCIAESGFDITEVISGTSAGIDKLGEKWAKIHGVHLTRMPAKWQDSQGVFDSGAGYKRNMRMGLVAEGAIILIEEPGTSGSKSMRDIMDKMGKPSVVVMYDSSSIGKEIKKI